VSEVSSIELAASPEQALAGVEAAAELWGAAFDRDGLGGAVRIPVRAGVRRGVAQGNLRVEPLGDSESRLTLEIDSATYRLQVQLVVVLAIAALGGLAALLWPLLPRIQPLAPFGAILALSAWFLVITRLDVSRPEDFLDAVAAEIGRTE
jgi:hypothetical protein